MRQGAGSLIALRLPASNRQAVKPASKPSLAETGGVHSTGFDAAFTACLFDAGQRKAMSDPTPWRTDRP